MNGGFLDTKLTKEARELEMKWILGEKVYSYRPRSEAQQKGITPIPLRWIDSNIGEWPDPFIRSRPVVREYTKGHNRGKALAAEKLFSEMPPVGGA